MHQTKTKILIWIILSTYLLTGIVHLSGIVLCFGADGHVEIEYSFNGVCGDFSDVFPETNSKPFSKNSIKDDKTHCGPCKDILILENSEFRSTSANNNPIEKQIAFSKNITPIISNLSTPLKKPFPPPPSTIPSTILSLRTITLLI